MIETVLWATRIGEPDGDEHVITSTADPERIKAASAWALANGFDRLRTSTLDLSVPPDFAGTVKI